MALGWQSLIGAHLADGRLVRLGTGQVTPEERHCLLVPTIRTQGRGARKLTEWLVAAFEEQQA